MCVQIPITSSTMHSTRDGYFGKWLLLAKDDQVGLPADAKLLSCRLIDTLHLYTTLTYWIPAVFCKTNITNHEV